MFRADGTSFIVKVAEGGYHPQEYQKGDVVTFAYDSFSRNSVPVSPRILRARKDLSWKEVLLLQSKPTQLGGTTQLPYLVSLRFSCAIQ